MKTALRFTVRNFEEIIASFTMFVVVLLTCVNVISYNVFKYFFVYFNEIITLCFTWTVFIGASACYKRKMHYGVTVFVSLIPRRGQRFVQTLVDLVLTVSLIYVTYLCWNLTASVTTRVTPFLHLSYKWIYMPTVIGMGLMGVHSIRFFIDDVMKLAGRREEAEKMFDDEVNYEGEKFL